MKKFNRKLAQSWAHRMEEATKPFLCSNVNQAFKAFCNVMVKQNKLFTNEYPLSREQQSSVNGQFKLFKNEGLKLLKEKTKVIDCAKHCYCCCHSWLISAAERWGMYDYKLYLEGRWICNQLLEYMNYDGVRRLQYLIDHPNEGIDLRRLFRETDKTSGEANSTETDEDCIRTDIPEWLKARYWELYNPQASGQIEEDVIQNEELSHGEGFLPVEKYDEQYVREVLHAKQKLVDKRAKGELSPNEELDLEYLDKVLQDALGYRKKGSGVAPKRKRFFKKPENNKAYSCIRMSINRAVSVFPIGSMEREMIDKNLSFAHAKFCWGRPLERDG